MVKLVCVTVVVSAFIIGFFIITSNYLNARACQCPQSEVELNKLRAAGFFGPPRASGLVDLQTNNLEEQIVKNILEERVEEQEEENEMKQRRREDEMMGGGNDLDLGDDTTLPKVLEVIREDELPLPREEVEAIVEAERELEKELVEEEEELVRVEEAEEEALRDVLQAQVEHMKKIRLPIDLILGNPALAGRDVNCEVERRQHH
ncbi:hypothetical protein Pcinc_003607 [Petrolisthes cinctipes]|uniref:Uncharacterized protein n=1 Tax=Petrolisthes cinctipes TaxID=88211 RepID=A0AAE1GG19_PETCI|nr:hypothetical protein Pcinc_003607 [Petrolisthes cinctipes]